LTEALEVTKPYPSEVDRDRLADTATDRLLWVWLSRSWSGCRTPLVLVTPATVVDWHRRGFRLFWTWKSRRRTGRPTVPADVRALICTMSHANPLWGAPRIHDEVRQLGIAVSQSTVRAFARLQKGPRCHPTPSSDLVPLLNTRDVSALARAHNELLARRRSDPEAGCANWQVDVVLVWTGAKTCSRRQDVLVNHHRDGRDGVEAARSQIQDKHRAVRDQPTPRLDFGPENVGGGDDTPMCLEKRLPRGRPLRRAGKTGRLEDASNRRSPHAVPHVPQRAWDP
jgi:hypothetical protein